MPADTSAEMRRIREEVVLLLMPVMNPDGLDLVAEGYRRDAMAKRFAEEGKPGVVSRLVFNTETALHEYATPKYYEPDSLPRTFERERTLSAVHSTPRPSRPRRGPATRPPALGEMAEQARALGANAVIGVDLDCETIPVGQSGNMLMVSASGTAVRYEG